MVLRCDGDGCSRQTTGEIVLISKLDWDLKHEDGWVIDQQEISKNLLSFGPGEILTKVWCPDCKEQPS